MHGLWSSNIPSRFLDELPEDAVEVTETKGGFGGYGASSFDEMTAFGSSYTTPGWQRAQARRRAGGASGGFEEDTSQDYEGDAASTDARNRGASARPFSSPPPERGRSTAFGGRVGVSRSGPLTIEGELVAKSTGTVSDFAIGDRVFHIKFGNGNVVAVDGNKLTIAFDKAGEKRVVDSFVERV